MTRGLTDVTVRALKPRQERYEESDARARGLRICVFPSGQKSFLVRYRVNGLQRKLTLPRGISLAEARSLASAAMLKVARGIDPAQEHKNAEDKAAAAAADTLRAVAENWLVREGRKLRTGAQRESTFRRLIFPMLGNRQIDTIKRSDINRLLDKIEDTSGAVMANQTLAALSVVFNWHATRSDDFRSPLVRGMHRANAAERARTRTLTDQELRDVWRAAEAEGPGSFGAFVQFLLLTSARRNEAAAMQWDELDGSDWTLPGGRNKTKTDLVRPLSKAAIALLEAQPRFLDCPFVFSSDGVRPLSNFSRNKQLLDRACGVAGWCLHDLRRTARSLMSRAGVNPDHAERCLGHAIPGVRATYDRHEFHDEKGHALEALAAQIERIINPQPNVVTLRQHV